MSKTNIKSVESATDSATTATATATTATGLMNVPVSTPEGKGGNGNFHTVWPKKDLLGSASQMAAKDDDRIVNKGEVVTDPATGEQINLIRVHRGKRVWYAKGVLQNAPAVTPATEPATEPAPAEATEE
jgi:hypothetical protein